MVKRAPSTSSSSSIPRCHQQTVHMWCLVTLPTKFETELVKLFRSVAGDILHKRSGIKSMEFAEAIYLLLTESFEERRLVDGYRWHIGVTWRTSKPQQ